MNDRISLLTRLMWRFGFNSCGLKSNGLISSSADVLRPRGKFDRIRRLITTNPALIGSRLSLNTGESWWTQDLLSKPLNCFTIRSKVKVQREEHRYLKKKSPRKIRAVWFGEGRLMATIMRWLWDMIARSHDPTIVMPVAHPMKIRWLWCIHVART